MTLDQATTLELPLGGEEAGAPGRAGRPAVQRRSPLLTIGLVLLTALVAVALLAPLVTSYDPRAISGRALETPSGRHWLGTDVPGRDIFAQLVYGTRSSLTVAVLAASLAMAAAVVVGVLPALVGGRVDAVSNRIAVFLLALPGLPLIVLIGSLAGNRRSAVILVIGLLGVAPNARVLRSQALTLRERGFVSAARGFGGGPLYVLRRHVVPGLGSLIVVGFVNWAGLAIGLEAGLAFLGLGNPSGISWGLMINRALAQQSIYFSPMWTWWVVPAGLAIAITVLGFTFVGVGLESTLNPRWLRSA